LSDTGPAARPIRRWWLVLAVAVVVIAIDQVTKSLALAHLSTAAQHVIGPFGFQLTYNSGSAFSLFQGTTGLLVVFDVVLIAGLCWLGMRATGLLMQIGIGLILGGALGNLADRAVRHHRGGVIDFITLSHWPTFNAADGAITIGAIVLGIGLLRDSSGSEPETEAT
jgi:signal peptidase II